MNKDFHNRRDREDDTCNKHKCGAAAAIYSLRVKSDGTCCDYAF